MRLTIDIGNTRIKTGLFHDSGRLDRTAIWKADQWEAISDYAANHCARYVLYSTVANEPPANWTDALRSRGCTVLALDTTGLLPFSSAYQSMSTLGQDRVAALSGAIELLPGIDCLVVDAGTCMTLDVLIHPVSGSQVVGTSAGTDFPVRGRPAQVEKNDLALSGSASRAPLYLGGNISPGIRMRMRAMHLGTSRLPLVEPATPQAPLGQSTTTALQHGGQQGAVYEIEGLYHRLLADHPDLRLLLTGGDAAWLYPQLRIPTLIQPHLVHYGLFKISRLYAD